MHAYSLFLTLSTALAALTFLFKKFNFDNFIHKNFICIFSSPPSSFSNSFHVHISSQIRDLLFFITVLHLHTHTHKHTPLTYNLMNRRTSAVRKCLVFMKGKLSTLNLNNMVTKQNTTSWHDNMDGRNLRRLYPSWEKNWSPERMPLRSYPISNGQSFVFLILFTLTGI